MKNTTTQDSYAITDSSLIMKQADDEYVLCVQDLPREEKPREKLQELGPSSLDLHELIAVLIGRGTRKEDVMAMSRRIVKHYGEKAIVSESDPARLAEALDIPITKSMQIVAAIEIGRRFHAQREGKPVFIRNAFDAYQHLRDISHLAKEQLRGLYLNSRRELVHEEVISVGSLTANIVHPREVFGPAIEHGAVAVIVAHNHPSQDPEPSDQDIQVTNQLLKSGQLLGIEMLDHLIITEGSYQSIKINKDI